MRQPTTTARMLHAQERRAFVLALRHAGATYQRIFEAAQRHFGAHLPRSYCPRHVYNDVVHAMRAVQAEMDETAQLVRALELERLDALQGRLWPRAMQGELAAVTSILGIMDRRARLLGLYGPVKCARPTPERGTHADQAPPVLGSDDDQARWFATLVAYGQ